MTTLLKNHLLPSSGLNSRIRWIADSKYEPHSETVLFDTLSDEGYLHSTESLQFYTNKKVLKAAEIVHRNELREIQFSFGKAHLIYWLHSIRLAWIFISQGQYKLAEDILMLLMTMLLEHRGPEHPFTLGTMADMASLRYQQGRLSEALELEMRIVETSKKFRGVNHYRTLCDMVELAVTYEELGKYKDAEDIQLHVLKKRIDALGSDHPDSLNSKEYLVEIYNAQGQWDEAKTKSSSYQG